MAGGSTFTPENAPQIAEVFLQPDGERFGQEFRLFLRAWSQLDGAAAVGFMEQNGKATGASSEMLAALGGSTRPRRASV